MRQTGVKLVFYPLTETLEPDITRCRELLESNAMDLFVLVHYFGRPTPCAPARDLCARHGAWLIEDAAHVLRAAPGIGNYGDFVLYSPHKHLAIPDGAVLVVSTSGPSRFEAESDTSFGSPSSWPEQLRELERELGRRRTPRQLTTTIWLGKRLLQKLGVGALRRSNPPFVEPLAPEMNGSMELASPRQSRLAKRMLGGLVPKLNLVARKRQRHQLLWDSLLLDGPSAWVGDISPGERATARRWTPYLAGYEGSVPAAAGVYSEWQRRGLPVSTWPDLPPEVIARREQHERAWHFRHSRLYLPVHQTMKIRSSLILRSGRDPRNCEDRRVRAEWDGASRVQWQQWFARSERSNLLQSWAYGEAKAETSNWRVTRGVFFRHDEELALVQVLRRRVGGIVMTRINRGPLLLKPLLDYEERAIWRELARFGKLHRGSVLSAAPELMLSGASLFLMDELGFRQFSPLSWESVWVDLDVALNVLRARIEGKWRNMLSASEKTGMSLEVSADDESFEWLIAHYQGLMQEKGFTGPSPELLASLRQNLRDSDQLIVLRAVHGGEAVAAIALALHGTSATYLLGWNGTAGRKLKANQYLLWQAIIHLQRSGLRWLDLGGISEEQTPGIADFKLGLGGERYELIGEYWRW
ncbi:MAG: bifunctional aminotransferase class I/II-fold pyridoxal phosphate-dependent enzyme/GNAT family N-acetyltransferase [Gemmatimonadota bacterium]|nr:bifunctional aminotransferase class I/II-fold pyridoxal phosphate-dependent enzyme/GNAT family N-acetyltransferase [Gemmatimonadota bacterium]